MAYEGSETYAFAYQAVQAKAPNASGVYTIYSSQQWAVDSPATIIPFERFLECREHRRRIATETGTVVVPASTDPGIQPETTPGAHADRGEPPRYIAERLVDA